MPGEFELIRRHFARPACGAVLGVGDDCALVAPSVGMELAISTDMLVAGTHFLPGTDPCQLGWKAVAVNLSDLAAMGAQPRWILLAISLSEARDEWLAAFAEGVFACAARFSVELIGGDTTRGPLNLCLTAIGEVPPGEALRRDRAVAGDDLWVSGQPGFAALGLAHLQGRTRLAEALAARCVDALNRPLPRVELGLALRRRHLARAAIDVSDGLLADLGHVLDGSRVGAEVLLAGLPQPIVGVEAELARRCQLTGGDDYELVFCAPPAQRDQLVDLSADLGIPLSRFGRVVDAPPGSLRVIDEHGQPFGIATRGYEHFA